ncbi:hypothetical protein [Cloacibacterium sp. TD35]|uniref:hypothetical protein n=1 Tax=Cloacibacterium sp. TD35 TaxID=2976818 RepID=UPI00237DA408|nr:hypothetical protein [Cloacibacterium sp. TD35]WDT66939.1 hypothetical protein N7277_06235 [Cloacibacterium sp. TD35]
MLTSQKSTEKSVLFIAEEAIIKGDIFIELYEKIPAELPKKKQKNVKKKLMEIKNPRKASSETKKIYQTKANQISPKNPDNTTALLYGKVQTAIGCTNDYRLKTIVDLYYFLALLEIKYDAHLVAFYMFVFFAGACSASAFIRPPPYSNYHSIIKILLPKYFTLINK